MQHSSPTLPANAWSIVASFLAPEELKTLYGVNRALFDLSMKERYWKVCFNGDKTTMKWLRKNIVRKHVRVYVRTVEIRPWQIEERATNRKSIWWTLLRLVASSNDELARRAEEHRKQRKVTKAIKKISDAVKELPNVREYTVQCPQGNCQSALIHGLLPSLTNWKDSLVKLTLCVPPDSLLCLAAVKLNRLEKLELVFWSPVPERFQYQVLEPLEVFINNLYTTLESLSVIATRGAIGVDLAPLFDAFGNFPHLRHFDLSMPFDGSSFSTIKPLFSFVGKHKGLQSLKLSTKPCSARRSPTQVDHKEWIPRLLDTLDDSFRDIQEVNVALRPLKAKLIYDTLVRFLSIHGQNLTSLMLTEEPGLSKKVVPAILGATRFYHVEQLGLNLQGLNEELFMLLATRFPRLKYLKIAFMHHPPLDLETLREGLDESRQLYLDWGLKRIETSCKCCPGQIKPILQDYIPSLEDVNCSTP